jgi:MscS family membrane protein
MRRVCLTGVLLCAPMWAQLPLPSYRLPAPQPETPKDTQGRGTPRGAVLGFLAAARKGEMAVASQYLNTRLRGKAAEQLAKQLFTVLDRRLPPRLQQLSDSPQGSESDVKSDQDLVGTISSDQGNVDIVVERVARGKSGELWLFSGQTLDRIPALYQEIDALPIDSVLPEFLVNTQIGGIPLFHWLGVFVGMPAVYLFIILLHRILSRLAGALRRRLRKNSDLADPEILPAPVRLLLVACVIYWMLSTVSLSLLARQFWSSTARLLTIAACVCLAILLSGMVERYLRRRLLRNGSMGAASLIRLASGALDVLAIFVGLLVGLYHFGLNPTAALAGLGVGGIAVALAAQKTLENVLGGISIVFDRVVCVGDLMQVGATLGTVEDIGLRSTRIRTFDRTVVSVPNGQIANLSLENLSARDKFWLHPTLSLRHDTTPAQVQFILEALGRLLAQDHRVERDSIRVRFLKFGASSLDLDVFAYVIARDWHHFLDIQGELLLQFMERVQAAGAHIALQSPLYLARDSVTGYRPDPAVPALPGRR